MLATDGLLIAKNHLQGFQKPGRQRRIAESVLDVFGEIAEQVAPQSLRSIMSQ